MKEALVVARWPVGGIRTFFSYVFNNSAFDNVSICFAVPKTPEAEILHQELSSKRVRFHWLPATNLKFIVALRRLVRSTSFELVHSHGFTAILATTIVAPSYRHIATVHDVLLPTQLSGIKGRLRRHALRYALLRADCVHTVSAACGENLLSAIGLKNSSKINLVVIRNGIDVRAFSNVYRIDLSDRVGITQGSYVVGFFGRFMSQKGFRYIVDAMEILRDRGESDIVILAIGSGGFKDREIRDIEARGLSNVFYFVDFEPKVADYMWSVDVILMPSLWEACGLVAMEALIVGTPLIASNIPALREIADNSPTRFVPIRDAASIANAITAERQSPRRVAATAYREQAAELFSADSMAVQIRQLYG